MKGRPPSGSYCISQDGTLQTQSKDYPRRLGHRLRVNDRITIAIAEAWFTGTTIGRPMRVYVNHVLTVEIPLLISSIHRTLDYAVDHPAATCGRLYTFPWGTAYDRKGVVHVFPWPPHIPSDGGADDGLDYLQLPQLHIPFSVKSFRSNRELEALVDKENGGEFHVLYRGSQGHSYNVVLDLTTHPPS